MSSYHFRIARGEVPAEEKFSTTPVAGGFTPEQVYIIRTLGPRVLDRRIAGLVARGSINLRDVARLKRAVREAGVFAGEGEGET